MPGEVRLDRMRPAEVEAALARAPVAWIPLGAVEYHAPHLPFGVDGFTAEDLLLRAARGLGGVVLPVSVVTMGTLHFPWTFRYPPPVVEAVLRETLLQTAAHGARLAVVHTGHAPLDLIHLVKRVCAEVQDAERSRTGLRAYGFCYLELNAVLGVGLGTGWPVAVDHASVTETSWMLAIAPELVGLDALPPEGEPLPIGVYGPDPRRAADRARGERQIEAAADLLVQRARALLSGDDLDPLADLRLFVERYWREDLEVTVDQTGETAVLAVGNPGAVSRYLSAVEVSVDGQPLSPDGVHLSNPAAGEQAGTVTASSLGRETGFYIRAGQTASVRLAARLPPGWRTVELALGLGGVSETVLHVANREATA